MKQSRRRLDPRVYSNGTERLKSQYALVNPNMAQVHLNDEVGAAPNSPRIYTQCGRAAINENPWCQSLSGRQSTFYLRKKQLFADLRSRPSPKE
jgi:hypothetical protein